MTLPTRRGWGHHRQGEGGPRNGLHGFAGCPWSVTSRGLTVTRGGEVRLSRRRSAGVGAGWERAAQKPSNSAGMSRRTCPSACLQDSRGCARGRRRPPDGIRGREAKELDLVAAQDAVGVAGDDQGDVARLEAHGRRSAATGTGRRSIHATSLARTARTPQPSGRPRQALDLKHNVWPLSRGRYGHYHGRPASGKPNQLRPSIWSDAFGRQLQRLVGRQPIGCYGRRALWPDGSGAPVTSESWRAFNSR